MQLIVGLGNPGDKYRQTRHNLGFLTVEALPVSFRFDKKFNAEIGTFDYSGRSIVCLKPQTFMNRSGESLQAYLNFFQIEPKECLVVHDELDLAFGEVRLKFDGGEAGHNGLKSISECLGTREYMRLRMGIGKPAEGNVIPTEHWVLSKFAESEKDILKQVVDAGVAAIKSLSDVGFPKAQSLLNAKSIIGTNSM